MVEFFRKLFKIIRYARILWDDFEDDFPYDTLRLLDYRLAVNAELMHDYPKVCEEIWETREHIHNYINADKVYEDISGGLPFPREFEFDGGTFVEVNGNTGESLTKEEEEEVLSYMKKELDSEKQEWDAIWDTIKKNAMCWWL